MRKLFLVTLVLFVAAGMVAAQDSLTVSGGVQQAWGFGDGVYENFDADGPEIDLEFTFEVDGVNTAFIKFENEAATAGSGNEDIPEIDEGYFETDLAAAFGLDGVILETRIGYWETDRFNSAIVTGLEFEDVDSAFGVQESAIQLEAGLTDVVTARFVLIPGQGPAMDGLVAVEAVVGPATVEVFFSDQDGFKTDELQLGVAAAFSQEIVPGLVDLSVGAEFVNDLFIEESAWGAGVSAGFLDGLSTLGISFEGGTINDAVDALGVDLNVEPAEFVGFDAALVLGISDIYSESLQYSEFSVYLLAGEATFRVGYAFYDGPKVVDGSGDALVYSDYNAGGFISTAESGFAFFNTSIDF